MICPVSGAECATCDQARDGCWAIGRPAAPARPLRATMQAAMAQLEARAVAAEARVAELLRQREERREQLRAILRRLDELIAAEGE